MKYFFTSDLHLGHANIIKYCSRPFNNLAHMNTEIIRRWNSRVKKEDTVFMIGDFCFKNSPGGKKGEGIPISSNYWKSTLNGLIIPVKGNHDKNNSTKTIIERLVIKYGGRRINLVHDPKHADLNYDINFTGHKHEKWEIKRIKRGNKYTDCINVGVDVNNFMPVTFDELMSKYYKWLKINKLK